MPQPAEERAPAQQGDSPSKDGASDGLRAVAAWLVINGILAVLVFTAIHLSQQRVGELESEERLAEAEQAADRGAIDEAITHYEYVARYTPERLEPRLELIRLLRRTGQDRRALEHTEGGLGHAETDDDRLLLLLHLGAIRRNLADWDASRAAYAQAADLAPDCAEAHAGLAFVAEQIGDYSAMRAAIIAQGNASSDSATSGFREEQRLYADRISELTAIDETGRNGAQWHRLGVAHLRNGQWDSGVNAIDQAIDTGGDTPGDAWYWAGAIAEADGLADEAIRRYQECLRRTPGHRRANQRLTHLKDSE